MAKLRLKAWYTLGEMARMAGVSRYKFAHALESNGVNLARHGRVRVVYLHQLKMRLPDLWESMQDRMQILEA